MKKIGEVAEELGISPALVRKLVRLRKVRFVRIGRCIRIPQSAIDELITAGMVTPNPQIAKRRKP